MVQGEFGWIEEIETTYVIVRTCDLRRLVVPLSYFIENPFQNWTRKTADLLGTVFVYVDYSVPVEEVRQELRRILQSSPLWDGKVWGLQVTNASDRAGELRAVIERFGCSEGLGPALLRAGEPHQIPPEAIPGEPAEDPSTSSRLCGRQSPARGGRGPQLLSSTPELRGLCSAIYNQDGIRATAVPL